MFDLFQRRCTMDENAKQGGWHITENQVYWWFFLIAELKRNISISSTNAAQTLNCTLALRDCTQNAFLNIIFRFSLSEILVVFLGIVSLVVS